MLRRLIETHVVEDEKLDLGAEIRRVGDAQRSQELLSSPRHRARVTRERVPSARVDDIAEDGQGRIVEERVLEDGRRVRDQQHVALVDPCEALHRRPVERHPVTEEGLIDELCRERQVLQRPEEVNEFQIQKLDLLIFDHADDVTRTAWASRHSLVERPGTTFPSPDRYDVV